MNRILIARSFRDSFLLLAGCCALALGFTWLRVWVASQINFNAFGKFFTEVLPILQGLLPVPLEDLATPLGRVAFTFEEIVVMLVLGLWTVTRASDCIAGRIGAGTMEMLLAQPLRRSTVVMSHTLVTLIGVVAIAAASWCGVKLGLLVGHFEDPPAWTKLAPGAVNFVGLGLFFTGVTTFLSAVAGARTQAVGLAVSFYVVEAAFLIASRLTRRFKWMKWLTILTAYEPTLLTIGLDREPAAYWPLFWQYNAWLFGLGAALLALSTGIFCRRDLPAPL